MPFLLTLDFLTGKYALVNIKKTKGTPGVNPVYGILLAVPLGYI